ncbi:hypothetical protein ccbrp13_46080 [Ktedonobacteria bacterium brp13]|nr:hypothetical protein ccbrp13_46080 [Ktedonobacteria bacterium brp13]
MVTVRSRAMTMPMSNPRHYIRTSELTNNMTIVQGTNNMRMDCTAMSMTGSFSNREEAGKSEELTTS